MKVRISLWIILVFIGTSLLTSNPALALESGPTDSTKLAREILANEDLSAVLEQAKALLGYGEIEIGSTT